MKLEIDIQPRTLASIRIEYTNTLFYHYFELSYDIATNMYELYSGAALVGKYNTYSDAIDRTLKGKEYIKGVYISCSPEHAKAISEIYIQKGLE